LKNKGLRDFFVVEIETFFAPNFLFSGVLSGKMSVFAGFELACEKLSGGADSFLLGVGVAVNGCLDVRMSHDALKGLDIRKWKNWQRL